MDIKNLQPILKSNAGYRDHCGPETNCLDFQHYLFLS